MKTSLMNVYRCCVDEQLCWVHWPSEEEVLGDYVKVYFELERWMEWAVNLGLSLNLGVFLCVLFFFFKSVENGFFFVLSLRRLRTVENTKKWECD